MLRAAFNLAHTHDQGLLALAGVICALAMHASTRLLCSRRAVMREQPAIRLGGAILTFGTGVWAAHFISILAYRPGLTYDVDVRLVALSLLLCMAGTGLAFMPGSRPGSFFTDGRWDALAIIVIRGLLLAAGIGSMHFVGMEAILMPGGVHYHPGLGIAAPGIGILGAIAAVWLLARRSPGLATLTLMLAVGSIHFIAIGSLILPHSEGLTGRPAGDPRFVLAIATSGGVLLILLMAVAASILDHRHSSRLAKEARRFRALADATFEGLVFERAGCIIDVNRAMCRLAESEATTLVGLRLGDLIPGLALTPPQAEPAAEHALLMPDGQTKPVEVLWRDDADHAGHVVAIRDLSLQKATELQIERLARFDSLTGLANRDTFKMQLQVALDLPERDGNDLALLYIDLDRFESISETLGPHVGEQILIHTARRLSEIARETDTVARLGRDQFAIIQTAAGQPGESGALAERIVTGMALPFLIDAQPVELTTSVGIAVYPGDGTTAGELMRHAALARRQAKQAGHGCWRYFEPGMDLTSRTKLSLEHDLRLALTDGQFTLDYQPFIAIESQELAGYEALLRWEHPVRGRISPADFIPLAEECGLIVPIGCWVLATACAEAVSWNDPVTISVNLSPAQFIQPGIVTTVADVLRRTGLSAGRLELEITEGTLMDDAQNALHILTALKALGVKLAMDDFGTGYSSLSYLRKFPFDKIKIDRSFISDVEDDAEAETIVQAIIAMGRSLRLDVTAEGIETKQQLSMLRGHGCTFAQGFLLGHPHPADRLGQHLPKDWPVFGGRSATALASAAVRTLRR
jgi:diguanylate cyclase